MKTRTIQQKYKILQYIAKIIFVHKKHGQHIAYAPVFLRIFNSIRCTPEAIQRIL